MATTAEYRSSHHIRWMIRCDLDGVMQIERSRPHPWQVEDFLRCLRQRNCIGMVARKGDEQIDGYMIYSLHKNKLELENFAVRPEAMLDNVADTMLQKMFRKLSSHRRRWLTATVRETDMDAIRFFSRNGFKAVRVIRGKFPDTGEDGYRMAINAKDADERVTE